MNLEIGRANLMAGFHISARRIISLNEEGAGVIRITSRISGIIGAMGWVN